MSKDNKNFTFLKTNFEGPFLIIPFLSIDERGSFIKDFSETVFKEYLQDFLIKEVFYTKSKKGVIRALHLQIIKQQPKLVRCISGSIYDVIVDLRVGSSTFKQWQSFNLSQNNNLEIYIPKGFGHGYLVLEDSIVSYKCGENFFPEYDSGIIWNDADLNITWPIDKVNNKIILSNKDKNLPSFNSFFTNYIQNNK